MPNITYQIRLPDHLRDDFLSACKENGLTGSAVIKQFMLNYISKSSSRVPVRKSRKILSETSVENNAPSSYIETNRGTVDNTYVPPDIFNLEYLESQRLLGKFYYYDEILIRHSVSEDEYWKIANSSFGAGKPDYWQIMDENELNYNISIGERSRPRFKQLFYTGDSNQTKNHQKRANKKAKKRR